MSDEETEQVTESQPSPEPSQQVAGRVYLEARNILPRFLDDISSSRTNSNGTCKYEIALNFELLNNFLRSTRNSSEN